MIHNLEPAKLWTKSFISLTLCSLLLFLNLQMLLSSFPAYVKDEFQATDLEASLVISVFAASAIATRFLTAFLIRKIDRNIILFAGLALAALFTGINMFAPSVSSLLWMRAGYGVGFGIASTIIPTFVSEVIPARRMGEGIGYFGLSSSLAMSIGPMIGLNVMKQLGFHTLAIIGTVTVALIFPILLLSRSMHDRVQNKPADSLRTVQSSSNRTSSEEKAKKETSVKHLLLPALLNVLLAVTYSGILSFIALFGEEMMLSQVGLFFLFNAITIVIVRPISGKIFDKMGPGAVLIPASISVMISMLILSFSTSMLLLIVSALFYGLGFGAIQPTLQAWMLKQTPVEQHGTANSMFYNSTDVGVSFGALVLGAISAATDYATMYRLSIIFMLLFIALFIFGQFILKLRRPIKTT